MRCPKCGLYRWQWDQPDSELAGWVADTTWCSPCEKRDSKADAMRQDDGDHFGQFIELYPPPSESD